EEDALGAAHVAEAVGVLVADHLGADQLGAVPGQPVEGGVEVVDGEHHPQVAERVDRRGPVVGDHRRFEEAGQLQPAVAVGGAQHRDLDPLVAQAGDPPRPLALDDVPPLELEAELLEEPDRRVEVLDDDADVVQGERHRPTLRDRHRRRGVDIATPTVVRAPARGPGWGIVPAAGAAVTVPEPNPAGPDSVNSVTGVRNADGSITARSDDHGPDAPNAIPITEGWNGGSGTGRRGRQWGAAPATGPPGRVVRPALPARATRGDRGAGDRGVEVDPVAVLLDGLGGAGPEEERQRPVPEP